MSNLFRVAESGDIEAIYLFLKARVSGDFMAWEKERACRAIGWYIDRRLCGVVGDADRLGAVVMGRPVASAEDGARKRFAVDFAGDVLWIQCVASDEGMARIWVESLDFLRSQGCHFSIVAWMRLPHDFRVRAFPIEKVEGRLCAPATA